MTNTSAINKLKIDRKVNHQEPTVQPIWSVQQGTPLTFGEDTLKPFDHSQLADCLAGHNVVEASKRGVK